MLEQGHNIAPGTVQAEVIPVIRTVSRRGSETKERPLRWVTQYWSLEGELLAEKEDENAVADEKMDFANVLEVIKKKHSEVADARRNNLRKIMQIASSKKIRDKKLNVHYL